jgi:predicted lipoprotein with Yx(FWY)xxD motif
VTLVLLAACGGDDGEEGAGQPAATTTTTAAAAVTTAATAATATTSTTAAAATVATATNAQFGTILVDATGRTLYTFDRDEAGSTACTGNCAQTWPPLLLEAGVTSPVAGAGVSGLGTLTRPEGGTQVTAGGKPLYRYAGDTGPGQVTGDGVGGVWHVAKP